MTDTRAAASQLSYREYVAALSAGTIQLADLHTGIVRSLRYQARERRETEIQARLTDELAAREAGNR
jgi:hypothetical protein